MLHYRVADRSIDDVVENGPILGVMPLASYQTRALRLGSSDRFFSIPTASLRRSSAVKNSEKTA